MTTPPPPPFDWPSVADFRNRSAELAALEEWWAKPRLRQMLLYGRRRVGKSWLFRRFAHGKDAVVLVVRSESAEAQFDSFAEALEPYLGIRPSIQSAGDLIRACYRASRGRKLLVVIDEFQNLLPARKKAQNELLKDIQAIIEEEQDGSDLRLLICGSAVRVMEQLLDEKSPLHGRFFKQFLPQIDYWHAEEFLSTLTTVERIERYAITGGIPQYLTLLGSGSLESVVVPNVLDRFGTLYDEVETVLAQELPEPRTYFSILRQLSPNPKSLADLTKALRTKTSDITHYLSTLNDLHLLTRKLPVGSDPEAHGSLYVLDDSFIRFWFRFVYPYQDEIAAGLDPRGHFKGIVLPEISDHVSPVFEEICRAWARHHYAEIAQRFGAWWGPPSPKLAVEEPGRQSEEIDIVGLKGRGRKVTLLGECKWQNKKMDRKALYDLRTYKIPALKAAGYTVEKDAKILLFSKSGYQPGLIEEAASDPAIELIPIERIDHI